MVPDLKTHNSQSAEKKNLHEPYKESSKPGAGSLKKINKIDKPLAKLTKGHRDSIQIYKIRNEKRDITTETEEIQKNHWILL